MHGGGELRSHAQTRSIDAFLGSGEVNPFLNIAIVNALTVIPLALAATLILRRGFKAPVQHAVWVLILLKLVTPQLFSLPMDVPVLPAPSPTVMATTQSPTVSAEVASPAPATSITATVSSQSSPLPTGATAVSPSTVRWWPEWHWSTWLLGAWFAGSAVWLAMQVFRAVRFEALISYRSRCPDDLQAECTELAQRLGIVHVPRVCVIDAPFSPMLWGFGRRAKLLFPEKLAARLPDDARATLLMHELAHYRRGDHRVRLLELLVTGLFWWHPVVWWARRQIEEAEEECCDAWVVEQFPQSPRCYAEALLDTIDFLCEQRRALPPLASGLGQAPFLRRRLTQIMQGTTLPPLGKSARWSLGLCAVVLLPLQPFVLSAAIPQRDLVAPATLPSSTIADQTPETKPTSPVAKAQQRMQPLVPRERPEAPPLPRAANRPNRTRKQGEVWSTAVSPDGRFIIRITTLQRVTLTDLVRNVDTDLTSHAFAAVAFSPDGSWFVSISRLDGRVVQWDAATGKAQRVLFEEQQGFNSIAVSPEGERIVIGSRTGRVVIIDLATREAILSFMAPSAVNSVRFSPNGQSVAVACGNWMTTASGQVLVYDATESKILHRLASVSSGAVSFASDEELIVGGWNGRIQLWNLTSGRVVAEAQVDKNLVAAASFSADNPALREAELSPVTTPSEQEDSFSFLRGLFDPAP